MSIGRGQRWMRGSRPREVRDRRSASPPPRRAQIEVRERDWRRAAGERARGAGERARAVDFL